MFWIGINPLLLTLSTPTTQGFESFVMRCPREVTPHLTGIIEVSLQYIKYDPNYSYGDDDEGDEDVDMDNDEYEEVCTYALTVSMHGSGRGGAAQSGGAAGGVE